MSRVLWRSLRTRIVLLAIITCAFLAVAAGSLYSFVHSSHTATVSQAEQHLSRVASGFARAYSNQAAHGVSLQNVVPPPGPHGPHPPPPPLPPKRTMENSPPPLPPADPLSQKSVRRREYVFYATPRNVSKSSQIVAVFFRCSTTLLKMQFRRPKRHREKSSFRQHLTLIQSRST